MSLGRKCAFAAAAAFLAATAGCYYGDSWESDHPSTTPARVAETRANPARPTPKPKQPYAVMTTEDGYMTGATIVDQAAGPGGVVYGE